jgi:hypothetical protein
MFWCLVRKKAPSDNTIAFMLTLPKSSRKRTIVR